MKMRVANCVMCLQPLRVPGMTAHYTGHVTKPSALPLHGMDDVLTNPGVVAAGYCGACYRDDSMARRGCMSPPGASMGWSGWWIPEMGEAER